ncbi:MAG: hypothetical protein A2007_03040 [Verrucomicrobia bacterium GWC2_42_7]|nr:MAG: hypothetical protein A2007_03040 [Verrucomicrobia bacterium GWC2_42_7]
MNNEEYIVGNEASGDRADKVLASHFTQISRTQLQVLFGENRILRNGFPMGKGDKLLANDRVTIHFFEKKQNVLVPMAIALKILYEDDDIVVVDKKSGSVVHPGNGTGEDTLVHALLHHCNGKLSLAGGELRPGVVHRLDKETSGVILFAKTDEAYLKLVKMFSQREIQKEYIALVVGIPPLRSGSIKQPIGRHPINRTKMAIDPKGRTAHTDWKLEKAFSGNLGPYALIHCDLHTGRTHQIRVHLSHIGHPIVGDATYGYKNQLKTELPLRVFLHAKKVTFHHPIKNTLITLEAPLHSDFSDIVNILG